MRTEEYVVKEWTRRLEKLVVNLAKRELRKLGRDSMQSGDDSPLCNVWEEICAQRQREESSYWSAYEDVIDRILLDKVERLDHAAQLALWTRTDAGWDWLHDHAADEVEPEKKTVDLDAVVDYLRTILLEDAANEDNEHITRYLYPKVGLLGDKVEYGEEDIKDDDTSDVEADQTSALRPDTASMRSQNPKPDTSRTSDQLTPSEIESLRQESKEAIEYLQATLHRKATAATR